MHAFPNVLEVELVAADPQATIWGRRLYGAQAPEIQKPNQVRRHTSFRFSMICFSIPSMADA